MVQMGTATMPQSQIHRASAGRVGVLFSRASINDMLNDFLSNIFGHSSQLISRERPPVHISNVSLIDSSSELQLLVMQKADSIALDLDNIAVLAGKGEHRQ